MQLATKIAVVLRDDLAVWQKSNVTAFLVSGIAGTDPDTVGVPYADASGNRYLPMFREPVLVYVANTTGLRRAYERAMQRAVQLSIYTQELFTTDQTRRTALPLQSSPPASSISSGSRCAPNARSSTRCSTARPHP